jgi:signal transduction histidine kinase
VTLPATPHHRRRAYAVIAVLFVVSCVVSPFAATRLRETEGFIPAIQAIIFLTDLATAVLLFTQFSLVRSRALLALANAYLFTAAIVVAHTLSFPGALAPKGLVGGVQTAGWLHVIWHLSFPAAVIVYVALQRDTGAQGTIRASSRSVIWCSVIGVVALVGAILWGLTAADKLVPPLFLDRHTFAPLVFYTGASTSLVCGVALLLLLTRKGSILDQWLAISVAATTAEMVMVTFFSAARFDVGWYTVRLFGVVSSTAVLLALLTETTRLYAKLSIALRALQRERDNKLLSAQAATAAIAHEMRQPLTAIAVNGDAALLFLQKAPPDLGEVRESLTEMIVGCRRASETIESIRSLFRKTDQAGQPIDVNEIILEVMQSQQEQAARRGVEIRRELNAGLPLVRGHKAQLQEVIVNLMNNAVEAMASSTGRFRLLSVKTGLRGGDGIAVEIQDSGPGIDPERLGGVFDAFVTTKPDGTGLGLAICRMIIEHHGGELTASSDGRSGAMFRFVLPVMNGDAVRSA